MPERVAKVTREVRELADFTIRDIQSLMSRARTLALNAKVEAARAGDAGRGFGVVADEVKEISGRIDALASQLGEGMAERIAELETLGDDLVARVRGTRLTDLARTAVETIDRNLFERTADVRWWATDSAFVEACEGGDAAFAAQRLGVILRSYTVYLDLWLCDTDGKVVANGRPDRFRVVADHVDGDRWFVEAMATSSGEGYTVDGVRREPHLGEETTVTYATAVRAGGRTDGEAIGVLGIHFDWEPLAGEVLRGLRLDDEERRRTRSLIIDAHGLVIACADGTGVLRDTVELPSDAPADGHEVLADGTVRAQALTPGYETYEGLGWRGVLLQQPPAR